MLRENFGDSDLRARGGAERRLRVGAPPGARYKLASCEARLLLLLVLLLLALQVYSHVSSIWCA